MPVCAEVGLEAEAEESSNKLRRWRGMRSIKVKLMLLGMVVLATMWIGFAPPPGVASPQRCITVTGAPFDRTTLGFLESADLIIIAIDNSGSVKGRGLLPTEKECAKAVVEVWEGKQFAVLSFNESITVEQYPTYDTISVFEAIDRIQDTENLTYMNGAIDRACEIIRGAGERGEGALVLSTDGFPTTPDGFTKDVEAAIEATRQAAENFRYNCSILAVVGVALEEEAKEFMEEISDVVIEIPPPPCPVEDFETGDFSKCPWVVDGWIVTDDNPHSGEFSAKAYIGTLEITLTTTDGILSFWIDSNCSGDLRLWMDGHEIGSWSDDCEWHQVEIPIHAGTHTFVWESYDGDDPYWLDDIVFPVVRVGIGVCPCPTGLRVPEDYSTIQAAIDAAEPGDCINVGPGTYREELWIDKDIILCGAGPDVTTIEGKVTIAAGTPHIEGFRITGSSSSGIIVNHYTKPTIWNNIIEHHAYDGITIWSLSEPEISYNVIRYNHGCGVRIDVPERTTVTGTGNEIYDNGHDLCPSADDFPPGFMR